MSFGELRKKSINNFVDFIYTDKFGKFYSKVINLEINKDLKKLEFKNLLNSTTGIDSQDIIFLISKFNKSQSNYTITDGITKPHLHENLTILCKVLVKLGFEEVVV